MRYVIAGYVFVLGLLALYAVQLVWRRRRLSRAVARVAGPEPVAPAGDAPSAPPPSATAAVSSGTAAGPVGEAP